MCGVKPGPDLWCTGVADGGLKRLNVGCGHQYLQESDRDWQAWPPLYRCGNIGGKRQANTDKHLNLIQTISLCLLQEAHSDRSKRPGGCINGSRGCLPVFLVHSHYPWLLLSPSLSLSMLVNLAVNDLRETLTCSFKPWSYRFTPPSYSLPGAARLRIYASSLCG